MTSPPRGEEPSPTAPDARPGILGLVHLLRRAGVTVPTGQVLALTHAAAALAPLDTVDLYWAGRAVLISHRENLSVYDAVFRALFFGGPMTQATIDTLVEPRMTVAEQDQAQGAAAGDDDALSGVGAVASEVELLRHRRFDQASEAELLAMRRLMARITLSVPERRTRRTQPVARGSIPDLRRSLRHAVRTDGEIVHRAWRRRRVQPRSLVLVLDVSGSMAGYARALLQFAFAARRPAGRVEVFCFGTQLTRVTRDLAGGDVDHALAAAAQRVVDWEGGTRIGDSLNALNRDYGRRGLLRGAVIVVCSDGLERGDPALLAEQMGRLSRFAHRIVWVNPLKGDDRYEPVQRGMQAALPFIDRLVSGHNLASLDELADVLGTFREKARSAPTGAARAVL